MKTLWQEQVRSVQRSVRRLVWQEMMESGRADVFGGRSGPDQEGVGSHCREFLFYEENWESLEDFKYFLFVKDHSHCCSTELTEAGNK